MLVISVKLSHGFKAGDDIKLTVNNISGSTAELSIITPTGISIFHIKRHNIKHEVMNTNNSTQLLELNGRIERIVPRIFTEESIVIAEDIEVRLVSTSRGQIKVAIEAPKDIPIARFPKIKVSKDSTEPKHTLQGDGIVYNINENQYGYMFMINDKNKSVFFNTKSLDSINFNRIEIGSALTCNIHESDKGYFATDCKLKEIS
jgi:carbon storage regulator CsrA